MPPAAPAGDVASQTVQKYAQDYAFAKIKTLPKRNNRTGKLGDLDRNQHPDFIYPLPNPTIHGLGAVSRLDPTKFQGLGSYVVVFAPDIYWDRHVTVCCLPTVQPTCQTSWLVQQCAAGGRHSAHLLCGWEEIPVPGLRRWVLSIIVTA